MLKKDNALKIKLDDKSKFLRRQIVDAIIHEGRGHLGPALSIIELLRVLYEKILNFNLKLIDDEDRDYFILSKGHGCLGLYSILCDHGVLKKKDLINYGQLNSILAGHPEHSVPGIEASTGSLGNGLPIAAGIALGLKIKNKKNKVYTILGDGEINEGSVWESFLHVAKHNLNNLCIMIDYNKFQSYDKIDSVVSLEPLKNKISSFNLKVIEINGHDMDEIYINLKEFSQKSSSPLVIICHTVKGKGIKTAENNRFWHHKNKLTEEEKKMIKEDLS